ncbi:hypothetical protein GCK72_001111 [Caenorhabditis remanei]|uniref:Uncharacterized protein n=1 Tax=Caenorhabditis remanei TaxID=31234 RepID=A0A6A5HRN8_CAERE|nr:hypothetical protein GCK72_001111 [Caenorhabditis remanei]KAF1769294.1 hypothetical protein GCK72_001111 [Caenorhabditis remanei]
MGNVESNHTNDDLVDSLVETRAINQRNIERAFRLVNYIKFVPAGSRRNARMPTRILHQPGGQFFPGALHMSAVDVYTRIVELFRLSKGQTVLNVGSGSGFLSTVIGILIGDTGVNHGIELYQNLLDYAEENMDKWARKKCASSVGWARPKLKLGDIYDPDMWRHHQHRYDRIYIGFIIRDKSVLCRAIRMLKIGGILLVPGNRCIIRYTRTSENDSNCETIVGLSFAEGIQLPIEQRPPTPIFESAQSLIHISRQDIRRQLREEAYTRRVRRYINASIVVPIGGRLPEESTLFGIQRERGDIGERVRFLRDQRRRNGPPTLEEVTNRYVNNERQLTTRRRELETALAAMHQELNDQISNRRADAPAHLVLPPERERVSVAEAMEADFIRGLDRDDSDSTESLSLSDLSSRSTSYSPSISSISSAESQPESVEAMDEGSSHAENDTNDGNRTRSPTDTTDFPDLGSFRHSILQPTPSVAASWLESLQRSLQVSVTPSVIHPGGPNDSPVMPTVDTKTLDPFASINSDLDSSRWSSSSDVNNFNNDAKLKESAPPPPSTPDIDSDFESDGDDLQPQGPRDNNPQREGGHQLPRCEYVNFLISRPTGVRSESDSPPTRRRAASDQSPSAITISCSRRFSTSPFDILKNAKRTQREFIRDMTKKGKPEFRNFRRKTNVHGTRDKSPKEQSTEEEEMKDTESTSKMAQDQETLDDVPGSSGAYPFGNGGTLAGSNQGSSSTASPQVSDNVAVEEKEEEEECEPGSSGAYPLGNGGTLRRPEASSDDSKFKRPYDFPVNKNKKRTGFGKRLKALFSPRNLKRNANGNPVATQQASHESSSTSGVPSYVAELAELDEQHRRQMEVLREQTRNEEQRLAELRHEHQEMEEIRRRSEHSRRNMMARVDADNRRFAAFEQYSQYLRLGIEREDARFSDLLLQEPFRIRWEETFSPNNSEDRFQLIAEQMAMAISDYQGVMGHGDDEILSRLRPQTRRREPEIDPEIRINFTFGAYRREPIDGNITGDEDEQEGEEEPDPNQPSTSSGVTDNEPSLSDVLQAEQDASSSDDEDANDPEETHFPAGLTPVEMTLFQPMYRIHQMQRQQNARSGEVLRRRQERNAFLRLANRNFHRRVEELPLPVSLRHYVKTSEDKVNLESKK